MAWMIEAEDVRKTYRIGKVDVPALRGVSLQVEKGEFVTIVGPSGSGKSTLFYILGGLTHADSGRVLIDGVDFTGLSDSARTRMSKAKIGFVFQKFNLLPTLTAEGNIAIARDIAGKSDGPGERARRTRRILSSRKIAALTASCGCGGCTGESGDISDS